LRSVPAETQNEDEDEDEDEDEMGCDGNGKDVCERNEMKNAS